MRLTIRRCVFVLGTAVATAACGPKPPPQQPSAPSLPEPSPVTDPAPEGAPAAESAPSP